MTRRYSSDTWVRALSAALTLSCLGCSESSGTSPSGAGGSSGVAGNGGSGTSGGSANAGGNGSGGVAGGSGGSTSGAGSGGDTCGGMPCNMIPDGLLDPDTTTTWNPGILSDDQLDLPLGADGLPVRTTVCASPMPGDDINAAIAGCPEGQVVELSAGTYTVSSPVVIDKGIVLRGAGSQGAADGGTTLSRTGGGQVVSMGTAQDTACYESGYDTPIALAEDALKGATTLQLGANAAQFSAGDLAVIDQVDDAEVQEGDCQFYKRVDLRSVSQRVEIASVDAQAGSVTLSSPLHWTFKAAAPYLAEIARSNRPVVKWAGLESVALQGGSNPGYNGQNAGGVDMSNAAYSWVKDVQTDQTIGGMHILLTGTYRSVVQGGNFHHSANYGFGADCYGIVLRCGGADNLIENNIVRYMNKPILFNVTGGGNVVAYNYADNSWATPAEWQEVSIDEHCSFPHMELVEGNYAPHLGLTATHGNAGYITFFRNYASSQFASPAVAGSTSMQTGNVTALQLDAGDINVTVIGNVFGSSAETDLGTAPLSSAYTSTSSDVAKIYDFGPQGMADVSFTTLRAHGNYDTVTQGVVWDPMISTQTIPVSLYRSTRPGWWPDSSPWPWTGADLEPRVGTLPAKARSDALAQ